MEPKAKKDGNQYYKLTEEVKRKKVEDECRRRASGASRENWPQGLRLYADLVKNAWEFNEQRRQLMEHIA
jgi:hypothetical protein